METLKTPNDEFNFNNLVLKPPISLNGGNHFIKYKFQEDPLYIQAPKCTLKQGIVKASKRMFCDLMFTREDAVFINWIENLESFSQKQIFENREKWFETTLEESDIENSFTPTIKIFKSGKYYILRVSIPTLLGNSILKIYDEEQNLVNIENIKENDTVLTALEIQGVKCSPRNFQIEIEMKQMLILKEQNIFEKCIFQTRNTLDKQEPQKIESSNNEHEIQEDKQEEEKQEEKEEEKEEEKVEENEIQEHVEEHVEENEIQEHVEENENSTVEFNEDPVKEVVLESSQKNTESDEIEGIEEIKEIKEDKFLEPVEFEIDLEKFEPEVLNLKKKTDVYYEMYRDALKRAKAAKDLALNGFLEAKRIKNTYMLEDIDDSDIEEDSDE